MEKNPVVERLSATSLAKQLPQDDVGYLQAKSPNPLDGELEGGAMRPGGAPNIYSREHIGILAQYASVGIVYGCIVTVTYPFFNNYLRMSGVASSSADVLTTIPWTCEMFLGIITDCFPIFGYRRRPYMVIGWGICAICLFFMAVLPIGDPYYPDPSMAYLDPSELTAEQVASINEDAPSNGTKFILLMIFADLGMVFAFTASNGTMVELSQREPEAIRGNLQTMIWVVKNLASILANVMVGFGMNSADYGGSYSSDIGFNAVMGVCCGFAGLTSIASWFFITEEKAERQSVRAAVKHLYDLIQHRVVYQIIAFQFLKTLFAGISVTAIYPIQSVWAKVEPVNSSVATIIGKVMSASALYAIKKYGLGWNWRWIIITAQLSVVFIDVFPSMFTTWDVYRSQWFWLGVPLLEKVPTSIGFIVTTYVMVEIIEEGSEASVFGLVSSVSTLASPFSTVLTKNIDANFDIATKFLQVDDRHVHEQVTYAYLCAYSSKIFSLIFVLLLPRQKAETQELKRSGQKSKWIGILTILVLVFTFEWSIMTNIMSIYPSTSCLKIAGGTGC